MGDFDTEQFEIEEGSSFSLSRSWFKFKTAFMGTLFVMANDMELSYTMNVLGMLITFLQLLGYPFDQNAIFPWNPPLTNWLVVLCNDAQLNFYMSPYDPVRKSHHLPDLNIFGIHEPGNNIHCWI